MSHHPHLSKLFHRHHDEPKSPELASTTTTTTSTIPAGSTTVNNTVVTLQFASDDTQPTRLPNYGAHVPLSPTTERARLAAQEGELGYRSSPATVNGDFEDDPLDDIHSSQRLDVGEDPSKYDDYMPETVNRPSGAIKINVRKVRLLYNPMSGAKKGEAFAKESEAVFKKNNIEVDMVPLERKGHGEELCETMSVEGIDVIACLGGDGTFHECVNGYMKRSDDARLRVPLAVLPGGTGNSFALELAGSTKLKVALEHIMRGLVVPIDIGEVYFPTDNTKIYSFNSLHWGMASKVNVTAEKLRWMGKAIRYTTAALVELLKGTKTLAIVEGIDAEGKRFEIKDEFSVCIANMIQTAAKGMKLAPDARLNDGMIDVILIRSSHTTDLAKVFKKFYDGTHKDLEFVDYIQAKSFSIIPFQKEDPGQVQTESDPEVSEEILDIDGELKGVTPFKCTVLQKSLAFIA